MKLKNTEALIKRFRDYVIQQSRSNLSKNRKNNTKELYNSLKGEIVSDNDYSIVGFEMVDYGMFQDQGVKGKSSSNKAPNSPFKFGSGKGSKTGKGGLTEGIQKWVKQRGIQFRDKKSGKFISYNSTAFLITRSIYQTGLRPSLFFTKPFAAGKNKYINGELGEAFKMDIDYIVDYKLKKIK
jgi:hypothetical protein